MQENRTVDMPLSGLFANLRQEATLLVKREIELARVEAGEKAGQITRGAVSLAVGGAVLFIGILFLMLSGTWGLSKVVDPWLAALIVGGVVLLVGVVMLLKGISNMKKLNLTPERTLETLKSDASLVRGRTP
ncbi:phage holin family protein [Skermanella sp. TT6]|uniref:Phage holin family protein n=1 Tax=Skermanella cutis TaxID=2775420 RepID=A0ABX7BIB0_9PROT|nr:phage holin family protein [Skermanella sp. TT6]QQP92237.1 phage holin family protein [Skermanella sp. TT6]